MLSAERHLRLAAAGCGWVLPHVRDEVEIDEYLEGEPEGAGRGGDPEATAEGHLWPSAILSFCRPSLSLQQTFK